MIYLLTFLWCIPSPYIFVMNAEAWVVYHGIQNSGHPAFIALAAACGQTIGYTILFLFAEKIIRRWKKLREKIDAYDLKRFEKSTLLTLFGASTVSIPPCNVTAAVLGLAKYNIVTYVVIIALGRTIRFMLLSYFPFLLDKI